MLEIQERCFSKEKNCVLSFCVCVVQLAQHPQHPQHCTHPLSLTGQTHHRQGGGCQKSPKCFINKGGVNDKGGVPKFMNTGARFSELAKEAIQRLIVFTSLLKTLFRGAALKSAQYTAQHTILCFESSVCV